LGVGTSTIGLTPQRKDVTRQSASGASALCGEFALRSPPEGISSAPALANWWEALGDHELDNLIETALHLSPEIRAAEVRLRQSRAGLRRQRRDALPKGSASAGYLHANLPAVGHKRSTKARYLACCAMRTWPFRTMATGATVSPVCVGWKPLRRILRL
jgi:outer membrane protein TolC